MIPACDRSLTNTFAPQLSPGRARTQKSGRTALTENGGTWPGGPEWSGPPTRRSRRGGGGRRRSSFVVEARLLRSGPPAVPWPPPWNTRAPFGGSDLHGPAVYGATSRMRTASYEHFSSGRGPRPKRRPGTGSGRLGRAPRTYKETRQHDYGGLNEGRNLVQELLVMVKIRHARIKAARARGIIVPLRL